MSVTAALVKELREKSGAGMMDCKKALGETGGDMDAAIDWLPHKRTGNSCKEIWPRGGRRFGGYRCCWN